MDKVPVIPSVVHHHQNPLESKYITVAEYNTKTLCGVVSIYMGCNILSFAISQVNWCVSTLLFVSPVPPFDTPWGTKWDWNQLIGTVMYMPIWLAHWLASPVHSLAWWNRSQFYHIIFLCMSYQSFSEFPLICYQVFIHSFLSSITSLIGKAYRHRMCQFSLLFATALFWNLWLHVLMVWEERKETWNMIHYKDWSKMSWNCLLPVSTNPNGQVS
jgi:hypothetical protein